MKEFCVLRKGVKSSGFPISLSSGIISIPKTVKLSEIMWIILPQWSCWFVPYHENWPLWGLVQIFCSIMEVCSFGWSTSTWSSFSRCWKFDVKKVKVNFHFSCLFTFYCIIFSCLFTFTAVCLHFKAVCLLFTAVSSMIFSCLFTFGWISGLSLKNFCGLEFGGVQKDFNFLPFLDIF